MNESSADDSFTYFFIAFAFKANKMLAMLITGDMVITMTFLILGEFAIQKNKSSNSELRGRSLNQRCAIICTSF